MMTKKTCVLAILDGWGEASASASNAISLAQTPNWTALLKACPKSSLSASGEDVGLPRGQMGNSEVGHMTIGSGRVIWQDLPRIDRAIAEGNLATNGVLVDWMQQLKTSGRPCHLMGLLSPGGVHSHQNHLLALCQILSAEGIQTYVHAFLDGRDTPPQSAKGYVADFLKQIQPFPGVEVVSLGGRYYGMDRDNRTERIERAYGVLAMGEGPVFEDPLAYIQSSYDDGVFDEFVVPACRYGYAGFQGGDGLLIGNFRADRVRQVLRRFMTDQRFAQSPLLGLTPYGQEFQGRVGALFQAQETTHTLGDVMAQAERTQLRLAETEKYAHVTYFFNGGREEPFPREDRVMVPSPKVATYDLQPEMSAPEVTHKLVSAIASGLYDLIVVNYANGDMVGHTGNIPGSIKAVEAVDQALGEIWRAVEQHGGILAITADHGNVETMMDLVTGGVQTAHTLNPVPFVLWGGGEVTLRPDGTLADIAPTLLSLIGLEKPQQMTGHSLVIS